jgi:uncharacterized protein GlcG (DUF336 family)
MLGRLGQLFELVEEAAEGEGLALVASAVDEHGNPVLLMRMKGSQLHAIDFAQRKAYTAISMRTATAALTPQVQPGQPLFGLTESSHGRLIPFGGGDLFEVAPGELVGVGISGGTTEQDIDILARAMDRVEPVAS